mgnify:CR=1 FL=1
MTARPSQLAGRFDHCEDDRRELTPAQQVAIERRTAELIAERLADTAQFTDLMTGIEPTEIYPHLQRITLNMRHVMHGHLDHVTAAALTNSDANIALRIEQEARAAWGEELQAIAEREIE